MKLRLTLLAAVMLPLMAMAIEKPEVGKWYFLTFNNSGNVVTSHGDGAELTCEANVASSSQCWLVGGSEADGYTFTDKDGKKMNVNGQKSSIAKGGTTLDATLFSIVDVNNGYTVRPKSNNNVALNQFGGSNAGAKLGLWDNADSDPGSVILFNPAHTAAEYATIPRLIPWPQSISVDEGKTFNITTVAKVTYTDAEDKDFIDEFVAQLNAKAGTSITAAQGTPSGAANEIGLTNDGSTTPEAYTLTINDGGIKITAGDRAGFFYAIQTLKQLLPDTYFGGPDKSGQGWNVAQLAITDKPNLGHRGFMLDVARHFFSKREVERVLDIMSLYKMNRFHFHLTDDQGWRIEIPEYPRLTTVGSRRSGSLVSRKFGDDDPAFFDDTPYGDGMYFTLDDLKEIVAYAKARNIEIIPEIDLPGHMVAALASYPNLSCDSTRTYRVRLAGGISSDVLNIGDDKVIDFLKCVLGHVATVFPYQYIHIGGDECPTGNWKTNAQCQQRIKDEGLSGVEELQPWLVEVLGEYLKTNYGKDIIVWDELLSHWKDDNTVKPVIMAWNSAQKTVEAANHGFKSIFVPYVQLYFDMMQVSPDQCLVDEPYEGGWGPNWVVNLATVYNANALQSIQNAGKSTDFVLGMQGNMWTESCNDSVELEYQMLPRLAALSETAWLPNSQKSWISFYNRLQHHDEIYDALGYTYAKHYIKADSLSDIDAAKKEARELLAETKAGEAGYVSADAANALQNAVNTATDAATVQQAIAAYKSAEVVQPDPNAYYQIISASTYYRRPFAGSSLYQTSSDQLHIHYTRQDEPQELWQFTGTAGNYQLKSVRTGKQVVLGDIGSNASFGDQGTPIRVDLTTVANKNFTYVPGAVTLSAVDGYAATKSGNVKRLVATTSGADNNGGSNVVKVQDEPQLCMPGTWKLVRVDNFDRFLQALVKKCEGLIRDNNPSEVGNYTAKAVAFVTDSLITPAAGVNNCNRDQYLHYVAIYDQFEAMEKTDNGPWATSFNRNQSRSGNTRALTSVNFNDQAITNDQTTKLYQNLTQYAFVATAGQEVTAKFNGSINWMHGYVYIDRENDGVYSAELGDNGVPAEGTDLMAYSFYGAESENSGYNSLGKSLTGSNRNVLNPPVFTVPQLADGFYMMRYKVDWNSIDPKGSTESGNDIVKNNGDIMDVRLRVYSNPDVTVKATANGGQLLTTAGTNLDGTTATIGQAVSFTAAPASGNVLSSLSVSHGILTGDSLKNGVAQRVVAALPLTPDANGVYTIPALLVDGDLDITAVFVNEADAIQGITADQVVVGDGHFYDLQGRRVTRPVKGVYIHNGHKYVIK